MKIPTKRSLRMMSISFISMVITYIVAELIIKGSFYKIEWDILLVILLGYFIPCILLCKKKKYNFVNSNFITLS